jgi:hypothetical protein
VSSARIISSTGFSLQCCCCCCLVCQTGASIKISTSPYSEYCSQEISRQSLYHLDPHDYTAVSIEQFKRCKSTLGLVQTLFHS